MNGSLEALRAEAERIGLFLDELAPEAWERPTRCPPMTARVVVAHMLRGAARLVELLARPVQGPPAKDAVSYYGYDPSDVDVVPRSQQAAGERTGAQILADWKREWPDALAFAEKYFADDPVLASPLGTIRLSEYLRTRVVEVGVHAMDVRDAFGLEPDATPEGIAVVCGVLAGILGAEQPEIMSGVRFTLTGTGREPLNDAERKALGPLVARFPLLA